MWISTLWVSITDIVDVQCTQYTGKNKERISPQIEAKESHSNLLGAICVLPASIVICVGKLSDFALSWQIKQNIIDGAACVTVIDSIF